MTDYLKKIKNYLSENKGVCGIACNNCPLSTHNNDKNMCCTAIKIVQGCDDTHLKKTYLSEFMNNYPDAELDEDGTPKKICPHDLGLNDIDVCEPGERHCTECWNQSFD